MTWLSDFMPAAIGGAASYFGQRSANQSNFDIAQMTNAANAKQVADMMAFQERMSGSAYQRQMADMRKAGLNPMLAASLGGASSPPGASVPQVVGAPMQNEMSGISQAASSAMEAKRLGATINNINESTRKIHSDIDLNNVLKVSSLADATLKESNARVAKVNAENMRLMQPGLRNEAALDSGTYGKAMRALNRSLPAINSASSAAKAFKPSLKFNVHK